MSFAIDKSLIEIFLIKIKQKYLFNKKLKLKFRDVNQ